MFCPSSMHSANLPTSVKSIEPHCLKDGGLYSIQLSRDIGGIASEWRSVQPEDNLFLQTEYLRALQDCPPEQMQFYYAVIYRGVQPVGLVYAQRFHVNLEESSQGARAEQAASVCVLKTLARAFKRWMLRRADYNVLIIGNLLLTGEHGFHFLPEIAPAEIPSLLLQTAQTIQALSEQGQSRIHLQLFKDFPAEQADDNPLLPAPPARQLPALGYHRFAMQPSMRVRIAWHSFEDYLQAMSSKYRVRARRAFKKGAELQRRALDLEEIRALQPQIYELYRGVAAAAGFNAFWLHPLYFEALKARLGERFELVGYFDQERLVAFRTTMLNGKELEAHFLGVADEYNKSHQVYLNILYDLIASAIYHRVEVLDLARTALEIKSSVGAEPHDMHCFVRHRNRLSNAMLSLLLRYLNPKENWQQRHPFDHNRTS